MKKRVATCACGQLRVNCAGDPVIVSLCHCLDCQKRTGSVFGIAAFFASENVEQQGEFRIYRRGSNSGFAVNFHFCPHCGSTVCWEPERKPDAIGVAVGSFADPAFPSPSQSVYDERRHAWVPPSPHTNDLPQNPGILHGLSINRSEKEAIAIQFAGLSARDNPMQVQLVRRQLPAAHGRRARV